MSDELTIRSVLVVLIASHLDHFAALALPDRQEAIASYFDVLKLGKKVRQRNGEM